MDRYEARLKEKDKHIKELVLLCLSNGIISRGLACEYLGCAREDLDDVIKEDILWCKALGINPAIDHNSVCKEDGDG